MEYTVEYLHQRVAQLERRVVKLEELAAEKNASGWWGYFFAPARPPKYSLTQ